MDIDEIRNIGVVGGGTMGFGIAINFALWGYPVVIQDLTKEILQKSKQNVKSALTLFTEEDLISEKWAADTLARITYTTDLEVLAAGSDFITECIVELSDAKKKLFDKLDELCPPQTILASNTSYLVLSDFAKDVKRQDKIIITHYFAPPHIVPGLEIARGPKTSDETFDLTYELIKKIHKVPAKVLKEQPGCLLNAIQGAMSREAMRAWAEGYATPEDIERGITASFGFRMFYEGPMLHHDLAGVWRWPPEAKGGAGRPGGNEYSGWSEEAIEKLRKRRLEGGPWFIEVEQYEEEAAKRDRAYVRRLKELYWPKQQET